MGDRSHRVYLKYTGGEEVLKPGESCLLPAALGEVQIVLEAIAELVVCYVPDLQPDVMMPLQQAGYNIEEIQLPGEVVQRQSSMGR